MEASVYGSCNGAKQHGLAIPTAPVRKSSRTDGQAESPAGHWTGANDGCWMKLALDADVLESCGGFEGEG